MTLKEIEIHYYAILREERGAASERITTNAATPAELYAEIAQRHNFTLAQSQIQIAINDEFAEWQTPLQTNDQVVFLPPVSGG